MYLKLRFKCECGSKFDVDNAHSQGRKVVCPNCSYTAVNTSDSGSAFQQFMNSAQVVDFSDSKITVEKIRFIPQ